MKLLGSRRAANRLLHSHYIGAYGGVRNLRCDVHDARHSLKHAEIVREAFPVPGHALAQRRSRNVFDPFHQIDEPTVILRTHRGETDAAVAHDGCGDAVSPRRRNLRVPGCLAVVMRMHVHPTRRDDSSGGFYLGPCRTELAAHFDYAVALNCQISIKRRGTGAVDQQTITNYYVGH